METFVWDNHFNTGLEVVDQQHHRLVDLINKLGESLIGGKVSQDALQQVFGELADYARYHFTEEERLMQKIGLDERHCTSHQRYHAEFIEQLATMWNARDSMADPAEVLHGFLRAWLGFHILGVDQAMSRQISLIEAGNSPADAFDIDSSRKDPAISALLLALQNLYHVLSIQNRDLSTINIDLEKRVAVRTSELAKLNQTLLELNQQLEALSNIDGLLGIANRRYFDNRLEEEWQRAVREKQPLSLLMIDIDNFKRYNDTYGHQAGDHCLQQVAQAAQSALKRSVDLLARYGGEELVVILPNTGLEGGVVIAEEIRQQLQQRNIPHANPPVSDQVTISIGVAMMHPDQQTRPDMLIEAATTVCMQRRKMAATRFVQKIKWRSLGDSNPCYRRERPAS